MTNTGQPARPNGRLWQPFDRRDRLLRGNRLQFGLVCQVSRYIPDRYHFWT